MVSLLFFGGGSGGGADALPMLSFSETLFRKVVLLSVIIDMLEDFLLRSGMFSWGFGIRSLLSSLLSCCVVYLVITVSVWEGILVKSLYWPSARFFLA